MTRQNTPSLTAPVPAGRQDAQRILEERALALARLPEADLDRQEGLDIVAFHLGAEHLGVPTHLVQEIQPLQSHKWSRVPCAPPFITGIVNLRGRIYSIMNLAVFWGLPPRPPSESAHILLVRRTSRDSRGDMELTLLTDDKAQARRISAGELNPPPPNMSAQAQQHVRGVTPDLLLVLDLERLLADPRIIVYEEEQ